MGAARSGARGAGVLPQGREGVTLSFIQAHGSLSVTPCWLLCLQESREGMQTLAHETARPSFGRADGSFLYACQREKIATQFTWEQMGLPRRPALINQQDNLTASGHGARQQPGRAAQGDGPASEETPSQEKPWTQHGSAGAASELEMSLVLRSPRCSSVPGC